MSSNNRSEWFDELGWLKKDIPKECIKSCYRSDDTKEWRDRLNFDPPRHLCEKYLIQFDIWTPYLPTYTDEHLQCIVLGRACWCLREDGMWLGIVDD